MWVILHFGQYGIGDISGIHESDKPTKSATRIDIDKVDAQNFRSVIVSMKDSFRINTCSGRLIVQINNMVTATIKIDSTTNSLSTLFETVYD